MTIGEVKALKNNVHLTFDTAHGKEVLAFIKKIGRYTATVYDSSETNDIIARDANRRLIQTIESIMTLNAEQILALQQEE